MSLESASGGAEDYKFENKQNLIKKGVESERSELFEASGSRLH